LGGRGVRSFLCFGRQPRPRRRCGLSLSYTILLHLCVVCRFYISVKWPPLRSLLYIHIVCIYYIATFKCSDTRSMCIYLTHFYFSQVVLQGILGASVGQKLLDAVGVKDDVARGVAIGT
jgi:hypothetical protein